MNKIGKIPVPRTVQDPKYRYQMPIMQIKVEGKGTNIRTLILNIKELAKDLETQADYIIKFMGIELGSQTTFKEDEHKNIFCSISGAIDDSDLNEKLDKFIDKFILCFKCKLPETYFKINAKKEGKELAGICKSCGFDNIIDPKHKLTSYIVKNPHEEEWRQKIAPEVPKPVEERKIVPRDELKYKLRKVLKATYLNPYLEESKETFQLINEYISKLVPLSEILEDNLEIPERLYKAIKRLRMDKNKYDKVGLIAFNFLFDKDILKDLSKKVAVFYEVLSRHRMDKYFDLEIVLNLEYFFYERFKDLGWEKSIPTILKSFYDEGFINEEFLKKWKQGDYAGFLEAHGLYRPVNNERILEEGGQFISWILDEDME